MSHKRYSRLITAASLAALAGCMQLPTPPAVIPPAEPSLVATGSLATTGAYIGVNEATPETVESLEVLVPASLEPLQIAFTASGTILFGDPQAPVRIKEYLDYSCEYCIRYSLNDRQWLVDAYVRRGLLSIERIFYPLDQAGEVNAKAALCGLMQNGFEPLEKELLGGHLTTETQILTTAKKLKMPLQKFEDCLKNPSTSSLLEKHKLAATAAGIERIPAFSIGDETWIGLIGRSEWRARIEN